MSDPGECRIPSHRRQLFDEASIAKLFNSFPTKKRGRRREDGAAERIEQLKQSGESWPSIAKTILKEFRIHRSVDAIRYLYRSRQDEDDIVRLTRAYLALLRLSRMLGPRPLVLPKRRGRPRKDQIRLEARKMHGDGLKWPQIAALLNLKYNQALSAGSYRKHCGSSRVVVPWRKLDLNIVRAQQRKIIGVD